MDSCEENEDKGMKKKCSFIYIYIFTMKLFSYMTCVIEIIVKSFGKQFRKGLCFANIKSQVEETDTYTKQVLGSAVGS